ncbi:MAG TPA: phage portal protein [Planctomycetaceae bacterium]|nr:phage portal protein [Planctomycetaceae bacterium]
MSLLRTIRAAVHGEQRAQSATPSYSLDAFTETSVSNRRVAGYPSVSQALQMIAGDCAKLPAMVYELDGENRARVPDHPALNLVGLWGIPNETDTTFDILFDWFFHCLLWGRSAIWIDRVGPDAVELVPLLPDRTEPKYFGGRRWFATEIRDENGRPRIEYLPNDDVLYLEYLNLDGLSPEHPVRLYRETFKQAINAQDFTSKYFEEGTQQGGILMAPPMAGKQAIENVQRQVEERPRQGKWFKTLVLKDGFRWQSTTSSLRDATAVELDENTARQVARVYNLPPSKLGLKDSSSYNSLDQDNRQYVDSCLSSWLIQARSQFHRKLLLPSEQGRLIVDYEIDSLQWADPDTKAKIAMMGCQWGFLDLNTARRMFNEPPLTEEQIAAFKNKAPNDDS